MPLYPAAATVLCFAMLPLPLLRCASKHLLAAMQLLQDLRALCSTAQRQPDGQLDLSSLVVQLQDLGYACYLKRNNPGRQGPG